MFILKNIYPLYDIALNEVGANYYMNKFNWFTVCIYISNSGVVPIIF